MIVRYTKNFKYKCTITINEQHCFKEQQNK